MPTEPLPKFRLSDCGPAITKEEQDDVAAENTAAIEQLVTRKSLCSNSPEHRSSEST